MTWFLFFHIDDIFLFSAIPFQVSSFCSIKCAQVAMAPQKRAAPKAKEAATAAKTKSQPKCLETRFHEDSQSAGDTEHAQEDDSASNPGSVLSDMEAAEIHKKRKAMLNQLATQNKGDSEEENAFKKRKLDEYQTSSKLAKNQILADWIQNDSRLKTWYSNVTKTREEKQKWKEHQTEGWMTSAMIAELNKLNPDKACDKERLDFLLDKLQNKPCPKFGERFGDKLYYYQHFEDVVAYENEISSGSKVNSQSDIKGKLVDPQLQNVGCVLAIQDSKKSIKIENPMLDALKKEIQRAKKMEGTGLALLPSLVLLRRQLNDEGQTLCDKAEKHFLVEAQMLAEIYEKAEKQLKDESFVEHEDLKCKVACGISTFADKIGGLKSLKLQLKSNYSL